MEKIGPGGSEYGAGRIHHGRLKDPTPKRTPMPDLERDQARAVVEEMAAWQTTLVSSEREALRFLLESEERASDCLAACAQREAGREAEIERLRAALDAVYEELVEIEKRNEDDVESARFICAAIGWCKWRKQPEWDERHRAALHRENALEAEVERLEQKLETRRILHGLCKAKIEAALAKIKEMRGWGNDGEYGEGYYDAVDEIEKALAPPLRWPGGCGYSNTLPNPSWLREILNGKGK